MREGYIENSERTQSICKNIIEMVKIIQSDLNRNEGTHYAYMLEKLGRAQWDLNVLIGMAESKKEEIEGEKI